MKVGSTARRAAEKEAAAKAAEEARLAELKRKQDEVIAARKADNRFDLTKPSPAEVWKNIGKYYYDGPGRRGPSRGTRAERRRRHLERQAVAERAAAAEAGEKVNIF